jgi:hypothetical protein
MSSSIQYNPNPPRVWSRVQNSCSVIAYKNDDPGANTNFAQADYERQMLLKGNILQYKKNSSSLTKKQRYTQIAKGMWTNRTKTWATQSDTYTNPNMTSLLRVNSSILNPSNNTFSSPPNPFGCFITAIPDGGNLVCNVVVDPCTQEVIKRTKSQQLCNPTTDSDVPGQIQPLCWNDGTQTWYPRQRYIMPTSGDKWPVGYKGFVSALTFVGPVLSVGTMTCNQLDIPLSWTFLDSRCAPITSFNVYQNGILILNVPVSQTSVTINETVAGTYMFYVTSLSNDIESKKSNKICVSTEYGYTSENAVITNNGKTITFLINGSITFSCGGVSITYTLVGGGGGGGGGSYVGGGGGGGGGGGEIQVLSFSTTITTYSVIVGNGGINGISGNGSGSGSVSGGPGGNGNNSEITGISISSGGFGGKGGCNGFDCGQDVGGDGGNGGNGGLGGAGGTSTIPAIFGNMGGGGGGGCYNTNKQGANGSTNGGDGYGSGGGGASSTNGFNNPPGINGGIGGINAGNGSLWNTIGGSGIPNKGGGGGGGQGGNNSSGTSYNGGNGGSGIVILNI